MSKTKHPQAAVLMRHVTDNTACSGAHFPIDDEQFVCAEHDRRVSVTLISEGDFFVESWGYDQTNIDFYRVMGVTKSGASVRVQQWTSKRIESVGSQEAVVPGDSPRTGAWVDGTYQADAEHPIVTKRLQSGYQGRPSIKVRSWGSWAKLWGGKPQHQTASGFGH